MVALISLKSNHIEIQGLIQAELKLQKYFFLHCDVEIWREVFCAVIVFHPTSIHHRVTKPKNYFVHIADSLFQNTWKYVATKTSK